MELHAHLNGSLSTNAFTKLFEAQNKIVDSDFLAKCKEFQSFDNKSMAHCFEKFKMAASLTSTPDSLKLATILAIEDFYKDNVIYLELRTTPKVSESMQKSDYLKCVLAGIQEATDKCPDMVVKLLPSINRAEGVESAKDTIKTVLELLPNYKDVIVGVDFSGNPESMSFPKYTDLLNEAREAGLKLAIHCGEVENDIEIEEMIDFGMDRCGHGTFINSKCLEIVKEKQIPIECCLSSNVACGTVKNFEDHHFKELFQCNHPVVICTDDFGVFNTSLSKELLIAKETFNLTDQDMVKLQLNAVDCSFASAKDKRRLKEEISKYFKNVNQ